MLLALDFAAVINDSRPLFVGANLAWGLVIIGASIVFSILTWKSRQGFGFSTQGARAAIVWIINAIVFIVGVIVTTKAFPRIGAGWVIAIFLFVGLAISASTATVAKKSGENKDKKDADTRR